MNFRGGRREWHGGGHAIIPDTIPPLQPIPGGAAEYPLIQGRHGRNARIHVRITGEPWLRRARTAGADGRTTGAQMKLEGANVASGSRQPPAATVEAALQARSNGANDNQISEIALHQSAILDLPCPRNRPERQMRESKKKRG